LDGLGAKNGCWYYVWAKKLFGFLVCDTRRVLYDMSMKHIDYLCLNDTAGDP
jgi:hypothetical protein